MKITHQWISLFLIITIAWATLPVQGVFAQEQGPIETGLNANSSGESDSTDAILIGLFAVIVGVLLWLGFKSNHLDDPFVDATPKSMTVKINHSQKNDIGPWLEYELDDSALIPLQTAPEFRQVGLRFRF